MATLILRPARDESIGHSYSSGDSGYAMISESSADDDSTYIYQSISSTSSSSATSKFKLTGPMPSGSFKITGAKLLVRGRSSGSGTYSGTYKLSIDTSSSNLSLSTSYQDSSNTSAASSLINNTYTSSNFPSVSIEITTSGKKSSSKDSNFNIRITQAYLELTYEEVVEETDALYIKQNGSWVKYNKVYKKINGSWVLQSDLTSVFNQNTNYVKGN